jgi:hypothetical protein
MEKHTIKLLGKGLRQELSLPDDLPFPIREALKALAEAESGRGEQGTYYRSAELRRPIDLLGMSLTEWRNRTKDSCGCA